MYVNVKLSRKCVEKLVILNVEAEKHLHSYFYNFLLDEIYLCTLLKRHIV